MAQYRGLRQICERMGWKDLHTPSRKLVKEGFLMFKSRLGKQPKGVWMTDDELIYRWQLAMARLAREEIIEREKRKSSAQASSANQPPDVAQLPKYIQKLVLNASGDKKKA